MGNLNRIKLPSVNREGSEGDSGNVFHVAKERIESSGASIPKISWQPKNSGMAERTMNLHVEVCICSSLVLIHCCQRNI